MKKQNLGQSKTPLFKTWQGFKQFLPMLLGIVLLIGLITSLFNKEIYSQLFTGKLFIDPIIGALFGSLAAGSPLISYLVGGELINQGVSLVAVSAFIITWVSVGMIQLPAEISSLGKNFAISRNILGFISAIIISILTALTLTII